MAGPDDAEHHHLAHEVADELARDLDHEVSDLTDPRTRRRVALRHVVDGGLPFLVFFAGYQWRSVAAGAVAAVVVTGAIAGLRLVQGAPLRAVGVGAVAVTVSAVTAAATGEGRAFFAPGVLFNLVGLVVTLTTLLAGRPATGVVAHRLGREDRDWRRRADRRRLHRRLTWFWAGLWAWHLAVLIPLYLAGSVGALAVVTTFILKPSLLVWLVATVVWAERSGSSQPGGGPPGGRLAPG